MKYIITENQIRGFERFLYQNERSRGTVEKYLRDLTSFRRFLPARSGRTDSPEFRFGLNSG